MTLILTHSGYKLMSHHLCLWCGVCFSSLCTSWALEGKFFSEWPAACWMNMAQETSCPWSMRLHIFEAHLFAWVSKSSRPLAWVRVCKAGQQTDFQMQFKALVEAGSFCLVNTRQQLSWHGRATATACKNREWKPRGTSPQGLKKDMRAAAKSLVNSL